MGGLQNKSPAGEAGLKISCQEDSLEDHPDSELALVKPHYFEDDWRLDMVFLNHQLREG